VERRCEIAPARERTFLAAMIPRNVLQPAAASFRAAQGINHIPVNHCYCIAQQRFSAGNA
jgi:hypothetical protein